MFNFACKFEPLRNLQAPISQQMKTCNVIFVVSATLALMMLGRVEQTERLSFLREYAPKVLRLLALHEKTFEITGLYFDYLRGEVSSLLDSLFNSLIGHSMLETKTMKGWI